MRRTCWWILFGGSIVFLTACKSGGGHEPTSPTGAPQGDTTPAVVRFTMSRAGLPTQGNWKCDPVFADVNHDGKLDLVGHLRQGYGPQVWLGDGNGGWTRADEGLQPENTSCGGGVRVADLNGDGHPDLAIADHCQGVFTYLGDGTGRWTAGTRKLAPTHVYGEGPAADAGSTNGAECIAVGDINEDGHLDLVVGASDRGGIAVYWGDGSGIHWEQQDTTDIIQVVRWTMRVELCDLNHDGHLDIASTCEPGPGVWLGDGMGGWTPMFKGLPRPQWGGIYRGLAVADIDGDGRLDLVVGNSIDGPEVFFQRDDHWEKSADVFPQMLGGAFGVAVGDIDRDGHLDMVVTGRLKPDDGYIYGVYLLLGDGSGRWSYVPNSGLPQLGLGWMWGVGLADVNADGVLDLAAAGGGRNTTSPEFPSPKIDAGILFWLTDLPREGLRD